MIKQSSMKKQLFMQMTKKQKKTILNQSDGFQSKSFFIPQQKQQSLFIPSTITQPQITQQTATLKSLYKSLFLSQQKNHILSQQILQLNQQNQHALARQIKENHKKTESLEMVAEEMAEKNQIIMELRDKINMIEQKYQCQRNGVLDDQITTLQKQVTTLDKVNLRLDSELRKIKQALSRTQYQFDSIRTQKQCIAQENISLKQKVFQLQQVVNSFRFKQKSVQKSLQKASTLLHKLKQLQKCLIKPHSQQTTSIFPYTTLSLQQQSKLQQVFIFLYNINDKTYQLSQCVFDQEQMEVLVGLKSKFIQFNQRAQEEQHLQQSIMHTNYQLKDVQLNGRLSEDKQSDGVYCHHQGLDSSVFQVLHQHQQANQMHKSHQKQQTTNSNQGKLTIKLLQMQIQKNKQIQKISQLKQKYMYIRNILFNLIKSLQLKISCMKTQTIGILELIFDVFQYSEEEKEQIFNTIPPKQKRFFGFI